MFQVQARTTKADIRINEERMEEKTEATWRDFQAQSKEVEARAKGERWTETGAGAAEPSTGRNYMMGLVPAPIREGGQAHLLHALREIQLLVHRLAGPGHQRATRSPKRSDLWRNPWNPGGSLGGQHLYVAYHGPLKTRTQGIGESLHDIATAVEQLANSAYPALTEGHIRREAGSKVSEDGVEDPSIKIQLLLGEENGERGSEADSRAAGHAPSSQTPQKRAPRHSGNSRSPPAERRKGPKMIGVLELEGAKSLPG
jgi:hypothetical protein